MAGEYHLFAGNIYYPNGGIEDYRGSFPSIEEAQKAEAEQDREWAQVLVLRDGALCCVSEKSFLQNEWSVRWHRPDEEGDPEIGKAKRREVRSEVKEER